ncbi:MAG TPA: hypothetical protein VJS92_01235, partial [Candidatus Polarisedimenticolaceae bacterium]|nr:hypothetical protein [Candidatus Polarisedimenticolaceae bacterium]
MHAAGSATPMFRQYRALKQQHPTAILLFRMGDFYEMFYEDAQLASRLLELTLTARGRGTEHVAPMCGFPHHQLDAYTARLVRGGQRVAICEQIEDPRQARGLVRRAVVRVVTPGTLTDPAALEAKSNLWIAGVATCGRQLGAAWLDPSTGEFLAWESAADDADPAASLRDRLRAFAPREIVHPQDYPHLELLRGEAATLSPVEPYGFATAPAAERLQRQLGVASLDGFGFRERAAAIGAAGGLLLYAQETQQCRLEHIDALRLHDPGESLRLDAATRRNLELEGALREGERRGTLLGTIDRTLTGPGGRLLRRWLLAPLLDPGAIGARHDAVAEL